MSSRKNGDIRGFFRSAGTSNPQPRTQPALPQPSTSDLSPPPDLPSSPITPAKPGPRVFSRDDEIKGSDESEEDDSDDSLGSITGALGYRSGPAAHRRDPNVLSTPQAKRIASGMHRSPLTLQPKKHKFDLKALINHSREIERTEASFRKADALIAQTEHHSDNSDASDVENDPRRLEAATCKLFVGGDDEDGKGDKVRRAFKRSKDDETTSRRHCYFFNQEEHPPSPGSNTFPRKKLTGPWKCLSQSDARRRAFIMGLPYTLLARGEALPDELFLWILDELCREQNAELRRQYINLAELCEDNIARLVNDMRLYALLERIGGPKYAREPIKFKSTTDIRPEYLERNWSPLVTFLQLLDRIAPYMRTGPAVSAIQLLLRMSMDPVVIAVVREHYVRAITTLVSSLAKCRSKWNTACEAICSYLYENVDDLELKVTALLSIPSSSSHLVDLRRRLAAESLFNRPGLGSKPVDPRLSFDTVRNRLDEDDFKSANRADFDYERLRALTTLLDIVIDRAEFMRPAATTTRLSETEIGTGSSLLDRNGDAEQQQRQFDAEIDALAARVKAIHDRIRDKASRKNVKLSLLGLEKRLKYAVRTRPPPKREIFAFEGTPSSSSSSSARAEPGVDLPRQRDFMRQWALKKKEAEAENKAGSLDGEDGVLETAPLVGDGRQRRPRRPAKNVEVAVG